MPPPGTNGNSPTIWKDVTGIAFIRAITSAKMEILHAAKKN